MGKIFGKIDNLRASFYNDAITFSNNYYVKPHHIALHGKKKPLLFIFHFLFSGAAQFNESSFFSQINSLEISYAKSKRRKKKFLEMASNEGKKVERKRKPTNPL